eukprot:7049379-Prymnesium_polylepis.1
MLLSQLRAVIGDDSHNDDELRWLLAKHDGDIGSAVAEVMDSQHTEQPARHDPAPADSDAPQ